MPGGDRPVRRLGEAAQEIAHVFDLLRIGGTAEEISRRRPPLRHIAQQLTIEGSQPIPEHIGERHADHLMVSGHGDQTSVPGVGPDLLLASTGNEHLGRSQTHHGIDVFDDQLVVPGPD